MTQLSGSAFYNQCFIDVSKIQYIKNRQTKDTLS